MGVNVSKVGVGAQSVEDLRYRYRHYTGESVRTTVQQKAQAENREETVHGNKFYK